MLKNVRQSAPKTVPKETALNTNPYPKVFLPPIKNLKSPVQLKFLPIAGAAAAAHSKGIKDTSFPLEGANATNVIGSNESQSEVIMEGKDTAELDLLEVLKKLEQKVEIQHQDAITRYEMVAKNHSVIVPLRVGSADAAVDSSPSIVCENNVNKVTNTIIENPLLDWVPSKFQCISQF